jgi:hypothetical protein
VADRAACVTWPAWPFAVSDWRNLVPCHRADENALKLFDLRSSYRPGEGWEYISNLNGSQLAGRAREAMTAVPWHKRLDAVVWVASNCAAFNGREQYISALMRFFPVHSYGKCLRNAEWPVNQSTGHELTKIELLQRYKFVFSWENANCDGYVTEKLVHAVESGAVPVVDGPRSYSGRLEEGTYVRVDNFEGPAALADQLKRLAKMTTADRDLMASKSTEVHAPKFVTNPILCERCARMRATYDAKQARNDMNAWLDGTVSAPRGKAFRASSEHWRPLAPPPIDRSCEVGKWNRRYFADGTMGRKWPAWTLILRTTPSFLKLRFYCIMFLAIIGGILCRAMPLFSLLRRAARSAGKAYVWLATLLIENGIPATIGFRLPSINSKLR